MYYKIFFVHKYRIASKCVVFLPILALEIVEYCIVVTFQRTVIELTVMADVHLVFVLF